MSDWSTLRDGDLVQLGVLQIDIEGHSKLQGTDRSLKDTKAMLRRHAEAIVGMRGGKVLNYAGDGGSFMFLLSTGAVYDDLVFTAIQIIRNLPILNNEVAVRTDLEVSLNLRISCDYGNVTYHEDASLITGDFLNKFLKYERVLGKTNAVTITEQLYKQVNARLKRQFEPYKFVGELNTQIYCTGPEMTGGNLQPDGSVRWPHLAAPGETVEVPDTVRNYCTLLAAGLSEVSPGTFVGLLPQAPTQIKDGAWTALEAETYWRLAFPEKCLEVTARALQMGERLAEPQRDVIVRLHAWSLWKTGDIAGALGTLKTHLAEVRNHTERGRYFDLLATLTRFGTSESFDLVLGWYQQSLSIKDASQDHLGYAITLQEMAFVYAERLDFESAGRYFRQLINFATSRTFAGCHESYRLGLLGASWVELIYGNQFGVQNAQKNVRVFFKDQDDADTSPLAAELQVCAQALNYLIAVRQGRVKSAPMSAKRSYWASLIVSQGLYVSGTSEGEALAYLSEAQAKPTLVPSAAAGLLRACKERQSAVSGSFMEKYLTCFWPLGMWLRECRRSALDMIRLLEGIANLYVAVIHCREGSDADPAASLARNSTFIKQWQSRTEEGQFRAEVDTFMDLIEKSKADRNRVVHGTLGAYKGAEESIVRATEQILEVIPLLRGCHWAGGSGARLIVAGEEVAMEPFITRSEVTGRLRVMVGRGAYLDEP